MPLCLGISAECTLSDHSPLSSCVCLTHFQQCVSTEGPCGAQREATLAVCVSAPLRRQSVSQSAHNTTLLPLQLATLPPPSPRTACLSTRQGPTRLRSGWGRGAVPILASDQIPLFRSLSPSLSSGAPQAGGRGLLEREYGGVL